MPSLRKRPHEEVSGEKVDTPKRDTPRKTANEPSLLDRIRSMWQFANLYQWIMLFGKAIKMDDDFDIEDLEAECLKPFSTKLQDIGLSMLKYLSSHRGLTHDLFDEYSRRQFLAKAPTKNPFGPADEPPLRFTDLDVFTKIRILQQMTQLIMMNPEKLREKTDEHNVTDQTNWRIEPYGWDRQERTYFVLDDNRVYRMTEPPTPAVTPKKNSKKGKAAARASKRRRISSAVTSDAGDGGDEDSEDGQNAVEPEDDGLGGRQWECVAVTLDEVRELLRWMEKTKDPDEKILRDQLQDHLVPILERQEESKKRKQQQRERELLALEKMAHAKRSSRLAGKLEHQKAEEQAREEERRRREEEAIARKEEQKRLKIEREREGRMVSREKRLKEREARRLQHEEELAHLSEDSRQLSSGDGRLSGRRLQAEIEKNKQALKEIEEEEDDWIFDCSCGVYGQVDDGTHSVACERCNVWQHSKCLGIKEEDAEREDFHFICAPCRRHQAEKPKTIKIKVKHGSSSPANAPREADGPSSPQASRNAKIVVELERRASGSDGTLLPSDQAPSTSAPSGLGMPRPSKAHGNAFTNPQPLTNGSGSGSNPFSSLHPTLSPPDQSPTKARAYHTLYQSNGAADQSHVASGNPLPPSTPSVLAPPKQGTSTTFPSTKTTPPVLFPPPGSSSDPNTYQPPHRPNGMSPVLGATPQLTPGQSFDDSRPGEKATPLPPSRGGLSPTKHSPPLSHKQLNGGAGTAASSFSSSFGAGSPKASILSPPPAAQLTPSPPQQILTPPVKHAVPAPRSPLQTHVQSSLSQPADDPGASS
ncbi:hypothetical protein CONLIGDRAFT_567921 [Coniochaeta ligniaria NRRL 30616]|uniref:Zinc finger PHD-type domain-containing protein n=1 Tax=Coniochaeta ligniaria NRRL 30616 TaxID=1408157 RepID=A0A1J7J679_9PEZI|nr:hypothetical protein CONLIGDRAFT_567921 [Coniochaeta ligniaria NRRL 30616]